jgi:glycosyltransferase involved in cell wall biosynthesis
MRHVLSMRAEVSVVIPVRDRQALCRDAIRTVLAQAGVTFEVVVVDDGSIEPFVFDASPDDPTKVNIVRFDTSRGPGAARNAGIRASSGDWIAFLDSDDEWRPGKLKAQLDFARAGLERGWPPLTCVMTGALQKNYLNGATRARIPVESWTPSDFAGACWFCPGSTAFIPRKAFDVVGMMDERLNRLEDLDWFLRLARKGGGIAVIPEIYADVRRGQHPAESRVREAAGILREKWLSANAAERLTREEALNLSAYLYLEQAYASLNARRLADCAKYVLRSFLKRPRVRAHLKRWWR